MKKLSILLSLMLVFGMLTGCGSEKKEAPEEKTTTEAAAETTEADAADVTGGWKIEVKGADQGKELSDVSVVLGYTGTGTEEFSKKASDGKEFLIVKLHCEKVSGQEVIDWNKLVVKDGDGNEYKRIEDSFLTDLNMKRLPGTELNFGTNDGVVAFEVNEGAKDFTLVYPFADGEFTTQF